LPSSNDLEQVLDSDNVNYEQITPVTVTQEAPQQIEAQVSVEALNRQIAAAASQTAAVSAPDSGEEVMVESVAAEPESAKAIPEDPF
jgi:hypothetical protein